MRTSTVEGRCQSRRHWVFSQHCLQGPPLAGAYLALPGSSQILRPCEFTGRRRMTAAGHKTPVGQASLWARGSPGVFTPTPLPEQRLRLCRRVNRLCSELLGSSDTIDSLVTSRLLISGRLTPTAKPVYLCLGIPFERPGVGSVVAALHQGGAQALLSP